MKPDSTRAVIMLSGGIDSCVAAFAHTYDRVYPLFFDYGQRNARERDAAHAIADRLQQPLRIASVPSLGPSALTRHDTPLPQGKHEGIDLGGVLVPHRNAIFAFVAMAYALDVHAAHVVIGTHRSEKPSGTALDNRPAFVDAINTLAPLSMHDSPRLVAPLIDMSKASVITLGASVDAPLHLTYSCYAGHARACGTCGTCCYRRDAFADAGIPDPTEYAT